MTPWDLAELTAHLNDHNIRTAFEVQYAERKIKRLVRHKGFDLNTPHYVRCNPRKAGNIYTGDSPNSPSACHRKWTTEIDPGKADELGLSPKVQASCSGRLTPLLIAK